mgnify:CR=1 FL=1
MRFYGEEAFEECIIKIVPKELLDHYEEKYIKELESYKSEIGYNKRIGQKWTDQNEYLEEYQQPISLENRSIAKSKADPAKASANFFNECETNKEDALR